MLYVNYISIRLEETKNENNFWIKSDVYAALDKKMTHLSGPK